MDNKIDIMKAKLARGGQVSGGEIRLIIKDFIEVVETMKERIDEFEKKLNTKPRGGSSRTTKPDSSD